MRNRSRAAAVRTLLLAALVAGCENSVEPTRDLAIQLEDGGGQSANIGSALPIAPVVRVVDGNDQPIANVRVNFAIASGGGSITGSPVTTDANGVAALGSWVLGSVGENHLTASVGSNIEPLTIAAFGRCVAGSTIVIDVSSAGNLSNADCRFAGGAFTDRHTFTIAAQRAIRFTQTSATVDAYLELQGAGGVVGFNDDALEGATNAGFKALLAPGTYDLNPSTFEAAEVGAYTVLAAAAPENETGCEVVFAMPGIETVQTLGSNDCVVDGFRYDPFGVYMQEGLTYTFTMNSPGFNTYLQLLTYEDNPRLVAENDNISGTNPNARIVHRARSSGFYIIAAQGAQTTDLGNYTLIVSVTTP